MDGTQKSIKQLARSEAGLFIGLLFIGVVIMPVAIYFVGGAIFGSYGGEGYDDFIGTLGVKIRSGDGVAWFLVLSPYLAVLVLRLMIFGWRQASTRSDS